RSDGSSTGKRSLATSDRQIENTMLGKVRIVVAAGDLQPAQLHLSGVQRVVVGRALTVKLSHLNRHHTGHRLRRCNQRAQVDGLTEGESVRMKQTKASIGQNLVAEEPEQFLLDVGAEVLRRGAYVHAHL